MPKVFSLRYGLASQLASQGESGYCRAIFFGKAFKVYVELTMPLGIQPEIPLCDIYLTERAEVEDSDWESLPWADKETTKLIQKEIETT
jgi:hypothetical protein